MRTSMELTLLSALTRLLEAAEYQMVDEDGVVSVDDQKTINYIKSVIRSAKK